jgi:hypothetical protein
VRVGEIASATAVTAVTLPVCSGVPVNPPVTEAASCRAFTPIKTSKTITKDSIASTK